MNIFITKDTNEYKKMAFKSLKVPKLFLFCLLTIYQYGVCSQQACWDAISTTVLGGANHSHYRDPRGVNSSQVTTEIYRRKLDWSDH